MDFCGKNPFNLAFAVLKASVLAGLCRAGNYKVFSP
ncbi:hypothetical protein CJA_1556 [Cellvibrio japonicus Ueda107]|uniref:Uncharacterized protein n=1 Tax=Cellvibrio japonicus (strain Ueda107) TaxID=498211 RepID=B3PE49_CELJU|nr:hypothetical protein CJA_1556 [Cellvibrio japonicus Ueda107]